MAGLIVAAGSAVLWFTEEPTRPNRKKPATPARIEMSEGRPVYPYSVAPGGVYSGREARDATKRDPVIGKHYAQQGVNTDDMEAVKLKQQRKGYVSYRVGDRIYWTKKKVEIKPGEVVVTDGSKKIRARCGNMISDKPKSPVLPIEPSERELNSPTEETKPAEPANAMLGSPLPSTELVEEERDDQWWPVLASNHAIIASAHTAEGPAGGEESRINQRRTIPPPGHACGQQR